MMQLGQRNKGANSKMPLGKGGLQEIGGGGAKQSEAAHRRNSEGKYGKCAEKSETENSGRLTTVSLWEIRAKREHDEHHRQELSFRKEWYSRPDLLAWMIPHLRLATRNGWQGRRDC